MTTPTKTRLTPTQLAILTAYADGVAATTEDKGIVAYGVAEKLRFAGLLEATNPGERGRRILRITQAGRDALMGERT